MPIQLLCTGLNGLVGSKLTQVFKDKYDFTNLDISNQDDPTDITDYEQVLNKFKQSEAKFVIHLAAFTNVNAAWEQRGNKDGLAYQVNVIGTRNIIKACQETNKHLIHVSTAFVFDGEKEGLYTEADITSPIEWYGETKAISEADVLAATCPNTVLRIDFPFRSDSFPRSDIARKTIESIEKGYPLFDNHYFGPTFIDDFVKVLDWVVRTGETGLFNASSGEQWSDFQLGQKIVASHDLDLEVKKGDLNEYLKTLQRPYQRNTALDNSKLVAKLDFKLATVAAAIAALDLS
jgi:dTDP-4-dehydrorhamnose reductase